MKLIIFIFLLGVLSFNFIFNNNDETYLKNNQTNNLLKGKYISNKLNKLNFESTTLAILKDQCPCQCNFSSVGILDGNGYGRYCGIKYTCNDTSEPGCNQVDDCCRLHDICVGDLGYCNSCSCNLKLIDCLGEIIWKNKQEQSKNTKKINSNTQINTNNDEFHCNTTTIQKQADYTIISDICYIIKYVPSYMCGGCPENTTIPQNCY